MSVGCLALRLIRHARGAGTSGKLVDFFNHYLNRKPDSFLIQPFLLIFFITYRMIRAIGNQKTIIIMKQPENIKELFSYRLNRLAFLSSTLAESINQDLFGLDKQSWRFIGLLAAYAPMSLKTLAKEANIDKSRASKAVASLSERGLIQRKNSDRDGRSIQLSLSEEGEKLYASAFPIALRRNNEILDVLTPQEKELFDTIIDKLIFRTKILMDLQPGRKKGF